jgi:hypothetical protein
VARELQAGGVLTGSPQRTDLSHHVIGSIVLDCTALRLAAWTPDQQKPLNRQSLGGALHPERPAPVLATWDEDAGWCVGLHHDPTNASRPLRVGFRPLTWWMEMRPGRPDVPWSVRTSDQRLSTRKAGSLARSDAAVAKATTPTPTPIPRPGRRRGLLPVRS